MCEVIDRDGAVCVVWPGHGPVAELPPVSAFVSPGMEVGAGGLSTWLPERRLQVTLKTGCLHKSLPLAGSLLFFV